MNTNYQYDIIKYKGQPRHGEVLKFDRFISALSDYFTPNQVRHY